MRTLTTKAGRISVASLTVFLVTNCSGEGGRDTDLQSGAIAAAVEGDPCTPPTSKLVINELKLDSDPDMEWVEIHNPGAQALDLSAGWSLVNEWGSALFSGAPAIQPGGYLVICHNDDPGMNGGVACDGTTPLVLSFDGTGGVRYLSLKDNGIEVDRTEWSQATSTQGAWALKHPFLDNGNVDDPAWAPSPGSPGARNTDVWEEVEVYECADYEFCTYDLCEAGRCWNPPKPDCCGVDGDCDDGHLCTDDKCDPTVFKCVHSTVPNCCEGDADCVDDDPCNADYCLNGTCRHSHDYVADCCYSPPAVNPLTLLPWSSQSERQAYADSLCDDKNPCTDGDWCDMQTSQCHPGSLRLDCCLTNIQCDDGDDCTFDICTNTVCVNISKGDDCCMDASQCSDGSKCTLDICFNHKCRNLFDLNNCCDTDSWCSVYASDGNPCTEEKCLEVDPITGERQCQSMLKGQCEVALPYVEDFDGAGAFDLTGWTTQEYGQGDAGANWVLGEGGDLGPDRYLRFVWTPTTSLVKTVAVTPIMDASSSGSSAFNPLQATTVQWRMSYRHFDPLEAVTLRVVASSDGDLMGGAVIWEATVTTDMEYGLYSFKLPNSLKFSNTLQIGFMVDAASTFSLDDWQIDDVTVAEGVSNELVKSKVFRCYTDDCNLNNDAVLVGEAEAGIPDVTMLLSDHFKIVLCYRDLDTNSSLYPYWGRPHAFLDGSPLDNPGFMAPVDISGYGNSCYTISAGVAGVCGAGVADSFCIIDLDPAGLESNKGSFRVGVLGQDEWTPDPAQPKHSPFQSLNKTNVNVLIDSGYIVWSPRGLDHPSALALAQAIEANGRLVQVIQDLDIIEDLSRYDGVFVVLGVYGDYRVLSSGDGQRLMDYLNGGGRVYLEGGDFFVLDSDGGEQPLTLLHPAFRARGTSGGSSKVDGPVSGKNFLFGFQFDYDQSPRLNSWNDHVAHLPGQGGREVLRNEGSQTFGAVVAFDSGVFRVIGSSLMFGGLDERGHGTRNDLMGKYLYFLENGYPPCGQDIECEDFEVCSDDGCDAGTCLNEAITGCIPCEDDAVQWDGSPSCGPDQACRLSEGICVDIECSDGLEWNACPVKAEPDTAGLPLLFGSSPSLVESQLSVPGKGAVIDIQVKVAIQHFYRGDLRVSLRNPDGTTVLLKQADLSDAARDLYRTFDTGAPLPTGQALDAFSGKEGGGVWTLVVEDTNPLIFNGVLEGWSLYLLRSSCSVHEDCDDGKVCTDDFCDPVAGCRNVSNLIPCDPSLCDTCHGVPPNDPTHQVHYSAGVEDAVYGHTDMTAELKPGGGGYAFSCGNCHPVDPSRHMNGVPNGGGGFAEIDLSPTGVSTGSLKAKNRPDASYTPGSTVVTGLDGFDYTEGTCANVYCHSMKVTATPDPIPGPGVDFPFSGYPISYPPYAVDTSREYESPKWGTDLSCGGCHGFPPRADSGSVNAGTGDSHSWIDGSGYDNLHAWNLGFGPLACSTCHFGTVVDEGVRSYEGVPSVAVYQPVPIEDFGSHVNGVADVVFTPYPVEYA
ncbi:MAG: hypothetical protein GXP54_11240, partial [Deltaproteobacteria bacterium]|nr:hypothetical protein [Deltaproteobacteria bacterium]